MAKNFGLGIDPTALLASPDVASGDLISRQTMPLQANWGDLGSDGWQRIMMGLALMDASKRRVNPPPLGETIAPLMAIMAKQRQTSDQNALQRSQFDYARGLMAGAPPVSDLFGDGSSAVAAPTSMPQVSSTGGDGGGGLVVGGGLGKAAANAGQYEPLIQSAAAQYGIPADIFTKQLAQESGFNPNAVSPAGAKGIAQFMPGTAQRFGIDPSDPNQAIPAAAKYVASNRDMFGGNLGLGLAGYNWGEGNVQKWLARGSDPAAVPSETRKYVQNITGQPIEAWAGQGGAGAPDTVIPSPDARAMPVRNVADTGEAQSQPGPRELAQARAYMPTTQPPPSPDTVRGKTSQTAAAIRSLDYWTRATAAAAFLGDAGKGVADAAKIRADIASKYLTEDQAAQIKLKYLPAELAARNRAAYGSPENNIPFQSAKTGATTTAAETAKNDALMRSMGIIPGTPEAAAMARRMAPDTRPQAVQLGEAAGLPQSEFNAAIAGAIPGNAPTPSMREMNTLLNGTPAEKAALLEAKRAGATMINTAEGFKSAQTKARLSLDVETAKPIIDVANSARRLMPAIDQAISLANSTPGGWAGPVSASLARAFSAAGWPVSEGMSNAELLTSINQRLIPLVREPGQQSNAEMDAYLRAGPGIMLSKEGRVKIGEMMKSLGNRAIEVARVYRQNLGQPDLFEKLDELDKKSVFTDDQKRVLQNAETLLRAKDAIANGASRDAVIRRLKDAGIDASEL